MLKTLVKLIKANWRAYLLAIMIVAICTMIDLVILPYVDTSNVIMVYLLGVVVVATWQGRQSGTAPILAAILSTLAFDFFFLEPRFPFSYTYTTDIITLAVMFIVALIFSYLTKNMQRYIEATRAAQLEADNEKFRNILLLSLSHDLRTPITSIMGSASSLLQLHNGLNESMRTELAQNIYDESGRLDHLIHNILQITRLESGMVTINKRPEDMEEIIGAVLNKLEKVLKNKPIVINLPENLPLIYLDGFLIGQVVINLVENAIKFSAPDSPIEISVELLEKAILIIVADRGPGLQPKDIEHMFTKFYRGFTPESKGIGLGLAICKAIVDAHHGSIWADNRKEGGTVFCFTLPTEGLTVPSL